jgi:hypothetical protein
MAADAHIHMGWERVSPFHSGFTVLMFRVHVVRVISYGMQNLNPYN